jgi:hypothetical protein
MSSQFSTPQQSTIRCEFPFVISSYLLSHYMCGYVIKYIQREQQFSCRFQLEPPSKPLLLDNAMSNIDEWFNASDENIKYISPVESWIE